MNPYAKTGDLRNPSALANLIEVRLFVEVEATAFGREQSKQAEDELGAHVTAALSGNGIVVGVNPATPALFVTVIGQGTSIAIVGKGIIRLLVLRVDVSLRETLTIPRAATSLMCTVWNVRTDVLVYEAPVVLSDQYISNLKLQVKQWISGQLSGFFSDRSYSADNKVEIE